MFFRRQGFYNKKNGIVTFVGDFDVKICPISPRGGLEKRFYPQFNSNQGLEKRFYPQFNRKQR
jgi:hypothetical protein